MNEDRLALMMDLFGPLPKDLLQEGKVSSRYFDDNGIIFGLLLYQNPTKEYYRELILYKANQQRVLS